MISELITYYYDYEYSESKKKYYLIYTENKVDNFILSSVIAINHESAIECIGIHSTFYHIVERYCDDGYTIESTYKLLHFVIDHICKLMIPRPNIIFAHALSDLSSIILKKYGFRQIINSDDMTVQIYDTLTKSNIDAEPNEFDTYMNYTFKSSGDRYILTYKLL